MAGLGLNLEDLANDTEDESEDSPNNPNNPPPTIEEVYQEDESADNNPSNPDNLNVSGAVEGSAAQLTELMREINTEVYIGLIRVTRVTRAIQIIHLVYLLKLNK